MTSFRIGSREVELDRPYTHTVQAASRKMSKQDGLDVVHRVLSDWLDGEIRQGIRYGGISDPDKYNRAVRFDAAYDRAEFLESVWPADFEWVWVARRGKLGTRVGRTIYELFGVSLSDVLAAKIGSRLDEILPPAGQHFFEFVAGPFEWNAGDFADGGSCFWGGRKDARVMMHLHGALALRFYGHAGNLPGDGNGRAWIVPDVVDNSILLFNGYSKVFGNNGGRMARFLADWTGEPVAQQIILTNRNSQEGTLYINGGAGYVVGNPSPNRAKEYTRDYVLDLEWDPITFCDRCEAEVDADDDRAEIETRHGVIRVCSDCLADMETCDSCGAHVPPEDVYKRRVDFRRVTPISSRVAARGDSGLAHVCPPCDRYLETCAQCGVSVRGSEIHWVLGHPIAPDQRVPLCGYCAGNLIGGSRNRHTDRCSVCGQLFIQSETVRALLSRPASFPASDGTIFTGRLESFVPCAIDFASDDSAATSLVGGTTRRLPYVPGHALCDPCSRRFRPTLKAVASLIAFLTRLPEPEAIKSPSVHITFSHAQRALRFEFSFSRSNVAGFYERNGHFIIASVPILDVAFGDIPASWTEDAAAVKKFLVVPLMPYFTFGKQNAVGLVDRLALEESIAEGIGVPMSASFPAGIANLYSLYDGTPVQPAAPEASPPVQLPLPMSEPAGPGPEGVRLEFQADTTAFEDFQNFYQNWRPLADGIAYPPQSGFGELPLRTAWTPWAEQVAAVANTAAANAYRLADALGLANAEEEEDDVE